MDPDMVRQQEEEETANRLRGSVKVHIAPRQPLIEEGPILLRADPQDTGTPPERLPGKAEVGWGTTLRAVFVCLLMTSLGLLGGIMFGIKFGLIPEQRLSIGAVAGFLLGWQAAAISLRRRGGVSLGRAMIAPLLPAAIILGAIIAAMVVAANLTGVSPVSIAGGLSGRYWLIVGAGALTGTALAAFRLRRALRS